MSTDPSKRDFSQRRRITASPGTLDQTALELIREQYVPQREIIERMWWATAEALNSDVDQSFNGLGRYIDELAALYAELRPSLRSLGPPTGKDPRFEAHARRWHVRARDVHSSLGLALSEEHAVAAFSGPRLQMGLTVYRAGPRSDLVRVGPQHEDPKQLVELARRRVRRIKGWSLQRRADAEGVKKGTIQSSDRTWSVLDAEVP